MSELYEYRLPDGRRLAFRSHVVYGAPAEVMTWVHMRLGETGPVQIGAQALGIVDPKFVPERDIRDEMVRLQDGSEIHWLEAELPKLLIGGVYFFSAKGADVYAAVAIDDFMASNPKIIREVLSYPFGQLGAKRITVEIPPENERAVEQARKLGFLDEVMKYKARADGGAMLQLVLFADRCPFWSHE